LRRSGIPTESIVGHIRVIIAGKLLSYGPYLVTSFGPSMKHQLNMERVVHGEALDRRISTHPGV